MDHNVLTAFSLTLLAGLSTGIGSALAFFSKKTNTRFLCLSLGFSAGVMIYVSFVEIFATARRVLVGSCGEVAGNWYCTLAFFGGIAVAVLLDRIVPDFENPHEVSLVREMDRVNETPPPDAGGKLYRMGIFAALAIGIHNFPEGLATFTAALQDPKLGLPIAVAIAIHNIPEGVAVSVPIFYATGSRRKAFGLSFLSGLAEPVGAGIGYLLLLPFFTDTVFGMLFAAVGGIMVFISLDELLPTAEEYGEHHLAIFGMLAGMAVMALSLLLLL